MKSNLFFLLITVLSFGFIACSDEDESSIPETNTIVDIAVGDAQFSTLVAALQRTNLVSTLQGTGPFTVFAPTNAAFTALGVDLATISDSDLTKILLNHVIGAKVNAGDIAEGQSYASTASAAGPEGTALSILIEKVGGAVTINGNSRVTAADVNADNGVIHIIDGVLMPLDLVGHAAANSNFSTLVGALSGAPGGLVSALQAAGPYTVFAPLNSAFTEIEAVVASLTPEQLTTVLTYHVVVGSNVSSTALSNGMSVASLSGQEFTVNLEGGASITDQGGGQSNIVIVDVQATNGIIHVIDKVLIPSL